jgi:DNA-binding transcriptional MerR regulator
VRIGEVATAAGVSVRALRYYEEQGLLESDRTPSGQRTYASSAVGRVKFIQTLYAAGLPSKAVLRILPCMESGHTTPEMRTRLVEERDRIQGQIDELTAARDRLSEVIRIADTHRGPADRAECSWAS